MGFRSLQHLPGSRIHSSRVCHTRSGPPSGFGYPLDGFRPSIPGRFCFTPAALLGFTLRSPQFIRYPARHRPESPTCRFRPPLLPMPKHQAGPTGRGSWVLTLTNVPIGIGGFSTVAAGRSPGFCPSRVPGREPWPGFRPASSHALRQQNRKRFRRPAPQSLDRLPPCPSVLGVVPQSTLHGRSAKGRTGDPLRV
jgi:hypothetical protein